MPLARRRPGDPDDARAASILVAQVDRAVDLRPERRDDARARARDRLLAVHGQPVPRGAAPRPDRRARRSRRPSRRAARPCVLRAGGRDRAVGPAPVPADRRCARSGSAARSSSPSSVFFALTFLPAVLGHARAARQRARALPALRPRPAAARPAGGARRGAARESRWERVAHAVMARPVAGPDPDARCSCSSLGTPFLRLGQGIPNAAILPAGLESRDACGRARDRLPAGETTPIVDPRRPSRATRPTPRTSRRIARLRDGASTASTASTGSRGRSRPHRPGDRRRRSTPTRSPRCYAAPRDQLPPQLAAGRDQLEKAYIRGDTVRLDAISPLDRRSARPATAVIPAVRGDRRRRRHDAGRRHSPPQGHDFMRQPGATRSRGRSALTLVASALILFLLFGSVVIPIKAVVMTLLSITASFGALVWIFQEGNLSNVLGFTSLGLHDRRQPDHHVQRPVRAVDGLRGPAAVADPGGVPADRRQHRVGRRGPGADRRRDHRRGADHGHASSRRSPWPTSITIKSIGVGHGDRGALDATIIRVLLVPGDDAAHGPLELVGAGPARPVRRAARASATSRTSRTPVPDGRGGRRAGRGGLTATTPVRRLRRWTTGAGRGERPVGPSASTAGAGAREERRPGLPWIGIFLVVFGGAAARSSGRSRSTTSAGNVVVLAAGLAFLVAWASGAARSRSTPARSSPRSPCPGLIEAPTAIDARSGLGHALLRASRSCSSRRSARRAAAAGLAGALRRPARRSSAARDAPCPSASPGASPVLLIGRRVGIVLLARARR